MLNLKQAQTIISKVEAKYNTALSSVKWDKIYSSEKEMIEELKQLYIPTDEEWYGISPLYKGYKYIHSFARQVQSGKTLTDKQIVQMKRLALEIKKAYSIRECYY